MLMGRREFSLLDLDYNQLDTFVKEVKAYTLNKELPQDSKIHVYKDQIACCGVFPLGIIIEIEGSLENTIKDLDLMIYSKVIEICERDSIDYHQCQSLELL